MGTHKNNEKMAMSGMFLPHEIIFEILTRVPIKSLLRFKCVCKIWRSTIEDPMFIVKHHKQASYIMVYEEDQGTKFTPIASVMGVTLERHNSNNTYRLRNLSTRQILNLPSASERKGICKSICYIGPTNELNVVYMDYSKKGNDEVLIYNVLRVGTHFTWKRLDSPLLLGNNGNFWPCVWPITQVIGSVCYTMRLADDNLYIDCLDLENVRITTTMVPRLLFYEWIDVWVVNWNGKLSLARIEQEQLNICVLENYRSQKWADSKIVVSLRFFIDYFSPSLSIQHIAPHSVKGNLVCLRARGCYQIFTFDTQSKKVKCLTPSTPRKLVRIYKPSLLPLRNVCKVELKKLKEVYCLNS